MIAYVIPGEIIAAATTAQVAAITALAVSLARTRERVTRLEEWARLVEKRMNGQAS